MTTRLAQAVLILTLLAAAMAPIGCTHKVQVEVTKVAPIHMTLDVNLRVQRELDDVFDFRWKDPPESTGTSADTPAPAPAPADQVAPTGGQP